jgi:hypothetical protein
MWQLTCIETRQTEAADGVAKRAGGAMRGVITGRDVLTHARLIQSEFGLACLLRCLVAVVRGEPTTFLDTAVKPRRP